MNYKYKAYLQNFFSILPKGETVNYFFQKYITKSLPIPHHLFLDKLEIVNRHFKNYKKYCLLNNPADSTYYEFGAGYDMIIPISMSMLGFKKLICIDIRELIFPELINDSLKRLEIHKSKFGIESMFTENIPEVNRKNYKDVLKKFLRIDYNAPLDAKNTGIQSNSIDFIISNATMEHIPQKDLPDIIKECYRILKPGGIMSNEIDYVDHYSYFDDSISVYNYLKFSGNEWKKLNPAIMYQNRMRHIDYIKIINETEFEILNVEPDYPDDKETEQLKNLNLNEYYRNNYSLEELSIKKSKIVLRKKSL
ncbi:MAG: class I SAM-dependent methyltransferase [Ignavibacteria bacterium]